MEVSRHTGHILSAEEPHVASGCPLDDTEHFWHQGKFYGTALLYFTGLLCCSLFSEIKEALFFRMFHRFPS